MGERKVNRGKKNIVAKLGSAFAPGQCLPDDIPEFCKSMSQSHGDEVGIFKRLMMCVSINLI